MEEISDQLQHYFFFYSFFPVYRQFSINRQINSHQDLWRLLSDLVLVVLTSILFLVYIFFGDLLQVENIFGFRVGSNPPLDQTDP